MLIGSELGLRFMVWSKGLGGGRALGSSNKSLNSAKSSSSKSS